jgi:hypothetical protein
MRTSRDEQWAERREDEEEEGEGEREMERERERLRERERERFTQGHKGEVRAGLVPTWSRFVGLSFTDVTVPAWPSSRRRVLPVSIE